MSGFLRPGSKGSKESFGIKFDALPAGESDFRRGAGARSSSLAPHAIASEAQARNTSGPPSTSGGQANLSGPRNNSLPVAKHRREILHLVETHATVIVLGETGSGKTTQIPQYLYEAGWADGERMIACTQPRRAAAASIAARVAEEMGCELGQLVGYSVRFDSVASQGATHIKFLTDGVLLREMMNDPLLTKYSVIMVDEAHERSLSTDMLLGLLKKIQKQRPDLRLIISSATLQAEELQKYFTAGSGKRSREVVAGAPSRSPAIISIEGRTHDVEVHYLQQPTSDYVRCAVTTAVDIHKADLPGDILIFLTGQEECEAVTKLLHEEARRLMGSSGYALRLMPIPLYAGMPGNLQKVAFQPTPRGFRKVIAATNIAETSLTLEDVVYVIDSCFVKQRCYNPIMGLESLLIAPTSQASSKQRAGRAGRVRAGRVFRLCTEEDYKRQLPPATVPEMQRSDLCAMVLQLKALGIDNLMKFEFLAPPPAETVVRALETLHALGVMDDAAKLTRDIGVPLADLPLDPMLGRCLLSSALSDDRGCSEEMLTIASMLSVAHIWVAAPGAQKALDEERGKFAVAEGDLASYLNIWRAWRENGRSHKWAAKRFLNQHSLLKAEEVRHQLQGHLRRLGLPQTSCDGDLDILRKALLRGMFVNAARFDATEHNMLVAADSPGTNTYRLLRHLPPDQMAKLRIHGSSVLFRTKPQFVVFYQVQQSDSGWYEMQGVTAVQPEWLVEVAPHMYAKRGM